MDESSAVSSGMPAGANPVGVALPSSSHPAEEEVPTPTPAPAEPETHESEGDTVKIGQSVYQFPLKSSYTPKEISPVGKLDIKYVPPRNSFKIKTKEVGKLTIIENDQHEETLPSGKFPGFPKSGPEAETEQSSATRKDDWEPLSQHSTTLHEAFSIPNNHERAIDENNQTSKDDNPNEEDTPQPEFGLSTDQSLLHLGFESRDPQSKVIHMPEGGTKHGHLYITSGNNDTTSTSYSNAHIETQMMQLDADEMEDIFIGDIAERSNLDPEGMRADDFGNEMHNARKYEIANRHYSETGGGNEKGSHDLTSQTDSENDDEKRKRKCLYLFILLLIALVAVLAALLGRKKEENGFAAVGAVGGTLLPPFAQKSDTVVPSLYPSTFPSIESSLQPSLSPSPECPMGTHVFSIEHIHHSERYVGIPSAKSVATKHTRHREHSPPAATATNNATWKIKDACTGDIVAECLPCSISRISFPSSQRLPLMKPRSNGLSRSFEAKVEDISMCLPINNEWLLEIHPAKDANECCGFDPTTSVIFFDDAVLTGLANNVMDESSTFFGEAETPCASESPSGSPSIRESAMPSLDPSRTQSYIPSISASSPPSITPTSSSPTQSPVKHLGGCPDSYVSFVPYSMGVEVEMSGLVYRCTSSLCGSYGFDPGSSASSLWRQAWIVVGSCAGTMEPTSKPTTSVSTMCSVVVTTGRQSPHATISLSNKTKQ